ncbi:MAG: extracellular solute-binding protein [Actinobacteria bacterium]|nr:extracellular solute-binding protein [Actinomycetota bacterium]
MHKKITCFIMVIVLLSTIAIINGCKPVVAPETKPAEEMEATESVKEAEAAEEKITLRMWWWGEDEAPGMQKFLQETGELFTKQNPNIKFEETLIHIDAMYPGFKAAVAAGETPDIHVLWGGVLGLEEAWAGNITPISDYWSEEELSHIYPATRAEGYWNGKQWLIPHYLDPWLAAINKKVWKDSGLDPDNPPTEWADFVAALEKIKAAGYIPWAVGIKDGYYGAWFPSLIQYQYYDSATDEHKAVIGEEKLTDPKHAAWWKDIQEIRDKGLFNDDAASLTLAEGNDLFLEGKVGFVLGVQPVISWYVREMGEDVIGVMIPPSPGQGKLKGHLPIPGVDLAIPALAKHKKEAAEFLKFMYSPERIAAMKEQTGAFPASDLLAPSVVKTQQDKLILQWIMEKSAMTYNYNYPGAFEEALYSISQLLITGDIDAGEAAMRYEETAEKWRKENPEAMENFKIWVENPLPGV